MTEQSADGTTEHAPSKKVSWAELYFDLAFVFVVSRLAGAVAEHHTLADTWTVVAMFLTLWWTWIGFAVLYNRYGDADRQFERMVVLVGTIPCAIAGVQVLVAVDGDVTGFALALAAARVLLAVAFLREVLRNGGGDARDPRAVWVGYALCALWVARGLQPPVVFRMGPAVGWVAWSRGPVVFRTGPAVAYAKRLLWLRPRVVSRRRVRTRRSCGKGGRHHAGRRATCVVRSVTGKPGATPATPPTPVGARGRVDRRTANHPTPRSRRTIRAGVVNLIV
jgi:Bacterial low temperature requirement A protein (LtrA)